VMAERWRIRQARETRGLFNVGSVPSPQIVSLRQYLLYDDTASDSRSLEECPRVD
jgi:hypothetical protein